MTHEWLVNLRLHCCLHCPYCKVFWKSIQINFKSRLNKVNLRHYAAIVSKYAMFFKIWAKKSVPITVILKKEYLYRSFKKTLVFQKGRYCKNTWKAERDYKIRYDGCVSIKAFKPKYCATCKRHRCCSPDQTKTISLEFECGHNHDRITVHDFMWIKSCVCRDFCPWILWHF